MRGRSIIFFETKDGHDERFKSHFGALRVALFGDEIAGQFLIQEPVNKVALTVDTTGPGAVPIERGSPRPARAGTLWVRLGVRG